MKRRERKWTKGKLIKEPHKHPILGLWARPQVKKIMQKRGEEGLHFNDLRYLLCKDYKHIKRPPREWSIFSEPVLRKMREYNDYTILQKDLTKLCDIGFLKKEARGFYVHVEQPVMKYIQDINLSGRTLIGSTDECEIVATESFDLSSEVEMECEDLFRKMMAQRAVSFESSILDFWKRVNSSKLDLAQKIIIRSEMFPFTRVESLKKVIKKECYITTKRGKETYDIPPFKKRNAEKLRKQIDIAKKYSSGLGNHVVKYAMGMYSYPDIFTEEYIKKKGGNFKKEIQPAMAKLQDLLLDFAKPCYVILAPRV